MDQKQEKLIKKWIKLIQKKGDRAAADELVTYYYKEIYGYTYKQTSNKELAMDLTQEIFVNMLQSIQSYDENKAGFRTWLYKIATSRIVDYYRSKAYRQHQVSVEMVEEIVDERDFSYDLEKRLEIEAVTEFVRGMDAVSQQIFRLKIFGEYPFIEIAQLLQLPESTVKTKFYAIIKTIRKQFKS